jgi:hypothetical protein
MKALPPVKRISSNIYQELSPPQRLLLAMIKISIEIHFTRRILETGKGEYQEQIQIKMLLDWQITKFRPVFDGVISMCQNNLILIWFDFTAFSGVETEY